MEHAMPDPTEASAHRAIVERFYYDMWNRFDKTLIHGLLTEDIVFRGSLGHRVRGQEEFGRYVDLVQAAFPDFVNHIEDIVTEGDRSFARLTYSGTHRGELFGIAPTGRRVEYAGAALFRFRDHRIAELWVLGDVHGLLRQLTAESDVIGSGNPGRLPPITPRDTPV